MSAKAALLKAIAPVNRGLTMTKAQKQAIFSAAAYLEDVNPHPQPTAVPELLSGNWRMLFTTSEELLGIDRLPLFQLGAIYQCIRADQGKIYNVAEILGLPLLNPLMNGFVSVCASFTVVSERRVKVNFDRFVAGSQPLINYRDVDQFIDLLTARPKLLALDFPIKRKNQRGWLETTYLDHNLRLGRGNEGNLFVLAKS
ncbi:MAG: PAP/fibrillin family protein [Pseudanabaena sp. ELA607]